MGLLNFNDGGNTRKIYTQAEYLATIKNEVFSRMDAKENGGNGDGKVTVNEAYNDLQVGSLFDGLKADSAEYNKLRNLTQNLPEILARYAGNDGEFTAQEWANFLNGNEWNAVLDQYHSSSNFAKIEMRWVDNSKNAFKDGKVTKGEVKVGILNNLNNMGVNIDTSRIQEIVDRYAGEDGTFTLQEYTAMLNDPEYKNFQKQYNARPFELD